MVTSYPSHLGLLQVPAAGCLSQSPSGKDGSAAKSCCALHERVHSPCPPGGFEGLCGLSRKFGETSTKTIEFVSIVP